MKLLFDQIADRCPLSSVLCPPISAFYFQRFSFSPVLSGL
jgi:hypothetical protein